MKFTNLMRKVGNLPCFTTGMAVSGEDPAQLRAQLARWTKAGRVIRLNRGLYTLAEPYRKQQPDPLYIANKIKTPSYISLQSALAWYGLIPELVPATMSVTTERPAVYETPLGRFVYRHIKPDLFTGYQSIVLDDGFEMFIALPEKALVDLLYLTPRSDTKAWIDGLRLQNLNTIDGDMVKYWLKVLGTPKANRLIELLEELFSKSKDEGVVL
jgi:predicted transcriptional regulator of viral defense system